VREVKYVVTMPMRDCFATAAMQGLLAESANPRYGVSEQPFNVKQIPALAECSYEIADAMLAAREATP
jgi:hypothetical protein